MPRVQCLAVPALDDNYVWLLHDGRRAVAVDPGAAPPVTQALDAAGLELAAILVTHRHADHVAGVDGLRSRLDGPVCAPLHEPLAGPHRSVREGDRIELLPGVVALVLEVPGHTAGHVAYLVTTDAEPGSPWLFCGDTLFQAGCGRIFDSTAAALHASLERLGALPDATRVCCAHEYTLANLRFAAAVEPSNPDVGARLQSCQVLRARDEPTLPATIASERLWNPFLRCTVPEVVAAARAHGARDDSSLEVFAALRGWKNQFR